MQKSDLGIVGLGVMGHNLALNAERNGYSVAGYNRDQKRTMAFLEGPAKGKRVVGCFSIEALAAELEKPRRIILMVPAGAPVDSVIESLKPHLEPGDMVIDGGNSYFLDTDRRSQELEALGINYIGMGVSGGEEGALWGPSMMPGGHREAWDLVAPILEAMAAKAEDGQPCVAYMGPRGAGHYVKMVHNGIEYADMQLIAEAYDLLHRGLELSETALADIFDLWNKGPLHSYLIEITATVLRKIDTETGKPLVDMILDEAQQKGTGKWTSQNSLDVGAPVPTIDAAVESRILSGLKEQRMLASKSIHGPEIAFHGNQQELIDAVRDALYASKITAYAQGMGLLKAASIEYDYSLNLREIARIWRAGCIIRADLLNEIMVAFDRDPQLDNLLLDTSFREAVEKRQGAWRMVVQTAVGMGIPVMAMSTALAYFDAYRSPRLPANLTQAQRDFFGAHTYRRIDREGVFHTQWE